MVRITKVYTRTGDQGETKLAAGKTMSKTSVYAVALGSLDELNTFLGFAAAELANHSELLEMLTMITRIQNELFDLGTQIAVLPADRREDTPAIKDADVTRLENEIDAMNTHLPTLKSFVLPQGGEAVARLHLARSVCRRAERDILLLHQQHADFKLEMKYLNRLSDWLFCAARTAGNKLQLTELLWEPGKRSY